MFSNGKTAELKLEKFMHCVAYPHSSFTVAAAGSLRSTCRAREIEGESISITGEKGICSSAYRLLVLVRIDPPFID